MFPSQQPPHRIFLILRHELAVAKTQTESDLFQGELTIITSKDARDVSIEDAPNYVLGYTIGNDLTARMFQDPKRAGGQFTRCKAFDGFAPLGPIMTSAETFGNTKDARILLKVNGRVFQDSPCDLIHGPAELISFLSQGNPYQMHARATPVQANLSDRRNDASGRIRYNDRLASGCWVVSVSKIPAAKRRRC